MEKKKRETGNPEKKNKRTNCLPTKQSKSPSALKEK